MRRHINTIAICKDDYKTEVEFEKMIGKTMMLLLSLGYICTIRDDAGGLNVIVIEYEHSDRSYGCLYPYWLYPEEEETIVYKEDI